MGKKECYGFYTYYGKIFLPVMWIKLLATGSCKWSPVVKLVGSVTVGLSLTKCKKLKSNDKSYN